MREKDYKNNLVNNNLTRRVYCSFHVILFFHFDKNLFINTSERGFYEDENNQGRKIYIDLKYSPNARVLGDWHCL